MTPTALYRHFDAAGDLLYVGISLSPLTRARQHAQRTNWFIEVARIDVEWFGTRGDAEQAEWAAIRKEHPRHNKAFARRAPAPIEQFVILDAARRETHGEPISQSLNVPSIIHANRQHAKQRRQQMRDSIAETISSFPIVV